MKTPFDAAARLRQRELDEVVGAIRAELTALDHVEREQARIAAALNHEAQLAAGDRACVSPEWQTRMRSERAALGMRQRALQARIESLRALAIDAFGVLRGIETAAEGFRSEVRRSQARAEQSASDDRSAAIMARPTGRARSDGRTR